MKNKDQEWRFEIKDLEFKIRYENQKIWGFLFLSLVFLYVQKFAQDDRNQGAVAYPLK